MLKELKALDWELNNNQMIRIPDSTAKNDHSLFRALSMAVFFSHQYAHQVKFQLRLTLISNLNERRHNPYPPLHQPRLLQKYSSEPQLLLDYWEHQELDCFLNDNLLLASAAFGMQVVVMAIDKEDYLSETYLFGSKNPRERRTVLARVGKKWYCVFDRQLQVAIKFTRQIVVEDLLGALFQVSQDEQPQVEQLHSAKKEPLNRVKQHKKSLSESKQLSQPQIPQKQIRQSGQIFNHSLSFQATQTQHIQTEVPSNVKIEERLSEGNEAAVGSEAYSAYYYQYPHYLITTDQKYVAQEGFNYMEPIEPLEPISNQRYTGRLKFFDHSGNYGFIVIDNMNIDLFVHYDDLSKAGLSKQKLLTIKNNYELRLQFTYYEYEGKQHRKSKKAVDLLLLQ